MELIIYWSPKSMQCIVALVNTRAESVLKYSNSDCFTGSTECTEGYGGHYITVQKAKVTMIISCLFPCPYDVCVSLLAKYTLGINILIDDRLDTMQKKFQLQQVTNSHGKTIDHAMHC